MKKFRLTCVALFVLRISLACAEDINLENDDQKSSYAAGVQYMNSLVKDGLSLDNATFLQGMQDSQAGRESRLTPEQTKKALDYIEGLRILSRQAMQEKRIADGKAFLEENQKQTGVAVLPSGLQYKILTSGQGHNNPKPSDGVSIRYRITSLDGKPLLSSPLELAPKYPLKALISGWREVLQLMKPGDKWQLFMPPALAFEKTGNRDGKILPYQTVISELELVAIVPIEEAQAELQHQDKAHSSAEIHFKPSHE